MATLGVRQRGASHLTRVWCTKLERGVWPSLPHFHAGGLACDFSFHAGGLASTSPFSCRGPGLRFFISCKGVWPPPPHFHARGLASPSQLSCSGAGHLFYISRRWGSGLPPPDCPQPASWTCNRCCATWRSDAVCDTLLESSPQATGRCKCSAAYAGQERSQAMIRVPIILTLPLPLLLLPLLPQRVIPYMYSSYLYFYYV